MTAANSLTSQREKRPACEGRALSIHMLLAKQFSKGLRNDYIYFCP